jgi:hypothetical protein
MQYQESSWQPGERTTFAVMVSTQVNGSAGHSPSVKLPGNDKNFILFLLTLYRMNPASLLFDRSASNQVECYFQLAQEIENLPKFFARLSTRAGQDLSVLAQGLLSSV